jgi:hypothetical protein
MIAVAPGIGFGSTVERIIYGLIFKIDPGRSRRADVTTDGVDVRLTFTRIARPASGTRRKRSFSDR